MNAAVSADGIDVRLGTTHALKNVSFDVERGSVLALIGPSGSGKTTLLRVLNGLCSMDAGTVTVNGRVLDGTATLRGFRELRKDVGMVFQQFNLWPHKTVLRNIVEAPVAINGIPKAEAEREALELLDGMSLRGVAGRYPRELSGGQQQRVAIARALAMHPSVLLLDEITSALDVELRKDVGDAILALATERDLTMVIATHELPLVEAVADTVLFLDEGRVVESGPATDVLRNPKHERTKAFLGACARYA